MALPIRRGRAADHPQPSGAPRPAAWDPFEELEGLTRQLNGFLDNWRRFPSLLGDVFRPVADLEETPEAYLVEIEVPGVRVEDVDIEFAGRRLSVHGERKEKERVGILRRRERTVGQFSYEVTLPGDVDEPHVEANLTDGVLTVRLPKPERDRPRRITVS